MRWHSLAMAVLAVLVSQSLHAGDASLFASNTDNGQPPECPAGASATGPSGPQRPSGNAYRGNPIHVGTGNKFHEEAVYRGPGEFPIEFKFYYNSHFMGSSGTYGHWSVSYSQRLTFDRTAFQQQSPVPFALHREDGQVIYFNSNPVGPTFSVVNNVVNSGQLKLVDLDGSFPSQYEGFQYDRPDGYIERFDANGNLYEVVAPGGLKHTIARTYSKVQRGVEKPAQLLCDKWTGNSSWPAWPSSNPWPGTSSGYSCSDFQYRPHNWVCRPEGRNAIQGFAGGTRDCDVYAHRNAQCVDWDTVIGQPGQVCDAFENIIEYDYFDDYSYHTVVTDSSGNQLSFSRSYSTDAGAQDLNAKHCALCPTSLTLPGSKAVSFTYNPQGLLQNIVHNYAANATKTFLYELNNNNVPGGCNALWSCQTALTGVVDEAGNRFASWEYLSDGRAFKSYHGTGAQIEDLTQIDFQHERLVSNQQSRVLKFWFDHPDDHIRLTKVEGTGGTNCLNSALQYTYGASSRITKVDYDGGRTINYQYGTGGKLSVIREAQTSSAERSSHYVWHPTFADKLLTVDQYNGQTPVRQFAYDYWTNGRLKSVTIKDLTTHQQPYATNGRQRTWNYSYTYWDGAQTVVRSVAVDGPRTNINDITTFYYTSQGYLEQVVNALGHATTMANHTPEGNPQLITDANGLSTSLGYHARGWLQSVQFAGRLYQVEYWPNGLVKALHYPNGRSLNYAYTSALKLLTVTDNTGNVLEFQRTINANDATLKDVVVLIKDAAQQVHYRETQQLDALGRVYKTLGDGTRNLTLSYGVANDLTRESNSSTYINDYTNDALGRTSRIDHSDGGISQYAYNLDDQRVSVTDQRGLQTTYLYDGFGFLIRTISPDTGTSTYTYDGQGNRVQSTDARGKVLNYQYDALNRLLSVQDVAEPANNVSFSYDHALSGNAGKGRLTSMTDRSGTTNWFYNITGEPVVKANVLQGRVYQWTWVYKANGTLKELHYPSGRRVRYQYDALGQVSAVTTQSWPGAANKVIANGMAYYPFGPLRTFAFGNGVTHTITRNQNYEVSQVGSQGGQSIMNRMLGYVGTGEITSISDLVQPTASQTFGYDTGGRLDEANGAYGNITYSYDQAGNRLSYGRSGYGGPNLSATYTPAQTSNQLASIASNEAGAAGTLQYSASGNLTADGRRSRTLTYNGADRLVSFGDTAASGQYTYNGFGQRVVKLAQKDVIEHIHFHYDADGNLLAETDNNGRVIREYIYGGGQRLAMMKPNPAADTDGDGMDDDWERQWFGGLYRNGYGDFDNDGINDYQEFLTGGAPGTFVDSDGDGMDDAWELFYFGGLGQNGSTDFDGDSFSNLREYQLGQNPTKGDWAWLIPIINLVLF